MRAHGPGSRSGPPRRHSVSGQRAPCRRDHLARERIEHAIDACNGVLPVRLRHSSRPRRGTARGIAVPRGLAQSPRMALYVVLLYAGVQAVETYVIAPVVDRKTVALPPALTAIAQLLLVMVAGIMRRRARGAACGRDRGARDHAVRARRAGTA